MLEIRDGSLVGIEVKASGTANAGDLKGLKTLETMTGERFFRGVMLYAGERIIHFGEKLFAVPISALWNRSSI